MVPIMKEKKEVAAVLQINIKQLDQENKGARSPKFQKPQSELPSPETEEES